MQQDEWKFFVLGNSGNLLRPVEMPLDLVKPKEPAKRSNLFQISHQKSEALAEIDPEPASTPLRESSPVIVLTEQTGPKAVEILRDICAAQQRFSDFEEALLCLALLEKQAKSQGSLYGFFEMIRDIDPNRARNFRTHLIQQLQLFHSGKSVAKIITEVFAQEWKSSQKDSRAKTKKITEEDLSVLLDFNRSFPKVFNLLRSFQRRQENIAEGTGRIKQLHKLKDAFYSTALLLLIEGGEDVETSFRKESSNVYGQFKNEFKQVFDALKGEDATKKEQTQKFFQRIFLAVMFTEVLVNYTNILKLEGVTAQSLCPDKKLFIMGHLKRYQEALVNSTILHTDIAKNHLFSPTTQNFLELTYNRNDILLRYNAFFDGEGVVFNFHGRTDNVSALKCTIE